MILGGWQPGNARAEKNGNICVHTCGPTGLLQGNVQGKSACVKGAYDIIPQPFLNLLLHKRVIQHVAAYG